MAPADSLIYIIAKGGKSKAAADKGPNGVRNGVRHNNDYNLASRYYFPLAPHQFVVERPSELQGALVPVTYFLLFKISSSFLRSSSPMRS